MAVMTTFIGLLPLLWATGAGADTLRRLATPIGGLATSFTAQLLLYRVLFSIAKNIALKPGKKTAKKMNALGRLGWHSHHLHTPPALLRHCLRDRVGGSDRNDGGGEIGVQGGMRRLKRGRSAGDARRGNG
jgi:hypothetical protein